MAVFLREAGRPGNTVVCWQRLLARLTGHWARCLRGGGFVYLSVANPEKVVRGPRPLLVACQVLYQEQRMFPRCLWDCLVSDPARSVRRANLFSGVPNPATFVKEFLGPDSSQAVLSFPPARVFSDLSISDWHLHQPWRARS